MKPPRKNSSSPLSQRHSEGSKKRTHPPETLGATGKDNGHYTMPPGDPLSSPPPAALLNRLPQPVLGSQSEGGSYPQEGLGFPNPTVSSHV